MGKNEKSMNEIPKTEETYKPILTREQAEKQLRCTYLAGKGLDAQIESITNMANKEIEKLVAEREEYFSLNNAAIEALEFYAKEKEE